MVLGGEPGWVCMMCCNADILFSVLVLHWVTSHDSTRIPPSGSYPPNVAPTALDDLPFDGTGTGGGTDHTLSHHSRSKGEDVGGSWGLSNHTRENSRRQLPRVTTHVTASRDADNMRDIPMDTITVRTEHMRQVEMESDCRSEASAGIGEVGQGIGRYEGRCGSTDEIVRGEEK